MKKLICLLAFVLSFGYQLMAQMTVNRTEYDSIKYICDTTQNADIRMGALRDLCFCSGNSEEIMFNARRLYALSDQVGNKFRHAQGASLVGFAYLTQGDFDKALEYAFEALNIYKDIDSVAFVAKSFNQVGSIFANMNNLEKSLIYYIQAYDVASKNGLDEVMAEASNNIGYIYIHMKLFNSALDYLSLRHLDSTSSKFLTAKIGLVEARRNLYLYYGEQKHFDLAFQYLKELEADENLPKDVLSSLNFMLLASQLYLDLSQEGRKKAYIDTSMMWLDSAEVIAKRNAVDVFEPHFITQRCNIYLMSGRLKEVPPLFMKYDTSSNVAFSTDIITVKKNYYIKTKNYSSALVYSELYNKMLNTQYSVDYASYAEKHPAEQRYLESQAQLKKQAEERIRSEEQEMSKWMFIKITLAIIAFFVVVFIIHNYLNTRQERLQSLALSAQKQVLVSKNGTLEQYQQEIRNQYREIEDQTTLLRDQRVKLNAKHKYLIDSIQAAQRMQTAVVPSEDVVRRIFGEAFVMWRPLNIVSGDFYWVAQRGNRKYLIVADCTGHGVPGAMLSILGVSLLNYLLPKFYNLDAAQILELLKKKFIDTISNTNIDDGMDLALIIRDGNKVLYSGANRPLLHVHDGEVDMYKPTKLCIGHNFMKENLRFVNEEIEVKPGDMIYAFSDGIPDQFGGDDGHSKFGNKQIKELMAEVWALDTSRQRLIMEQRIDMWRNVPFYDRDHVPQLDDQLLIGVRI